MNTLQTRNIDEVLRAYFQAEMPHAWPAWAAPAVVPMSPASARPSWLGKAGRLALAASVAFLLIGYLALASLFPTQSARAPLNGPNIGHKPRPPIIHVDSIPNDPKNTIILQLQRSSSRR